MSSCSKNVFLQKLYALGIFSVFYNVIHIPLFDVIDVITIIVAIVVLVTHGVRIQILLISLVLVTILTLSNLNGLYQGYVIKVEHLAFYYKWIAVLMPIHILMALTQDLHSKRLMYDVMYKFGWFLCFWCIIYTPLRLGGLIEGSWRVRLPFPDDVYASDAHVVSSLLGLTLSFFLITKKFNVISFRTLVMTIALFLTGSKTGVVLLLLTIFLVGSQWMLSPSIKNLKGFVISIFLVNVIVIAIMTFLTVNTNVPDIYQALISRATMLDLSDASSQGRLFKFSIALLHLENFGPLLGPGSINITSTWFDNGIAIILVHGGILMFIFCIGTYLYLVASMYKNHYFVQFIIVLFVAYFITEHFLISRHVIPALTLSWLAFHFKEIKD